MTAERIWRLADTTSRPALDRANWPAVGSLEVFDNPPPLIPRHQRTGPAVVKDFSAERAVVPVIRHGSSGRRLQPNHMT